MGTVVSAAVGIIVIALAFKPPAYLEYLIIYAIGGLEVLLFVPIIAGLYWRRGNALGATLAMLGGGVWYVVANEWVPGPGPGHVPHRHRLCRCLRTLSSWVATSARHRVMRCSSSSGAASGRSTSCRPARPAMLTGQQPRSSSEDGRP